MKTRQDRLQSEVGKKYTTVAQNKCCINVQGLLFAVIPSISVVFLQVIFISV